MVMLEAFGAAAVAAAKAAEPPPDSSISIRRAMTQVGWNEPMMTSRPHRLLLSPQLECHDEHFSAEAIVAILKWRLIQFGLSL